jgi:hypothetical protein
MKGSAAYWTEVGGAAAAQLFAGKWLTASTSEPQTASLVSFTDIDTLMTELFKDTGNKPLRKGREQRTGGHRAITVTMTGVDGGTPWKEMLARDGSLAELRELPPGHGACRAVPGEPWHTVGSLAEVVRLIGER